MTKNIIYYINGDDWVAIYINGKFEAEGHSIPMKQLIDILSDNQPFIFNYNDNVDMDWLQEVGNFPNNIEEVKFI